MRNPYRKEPPRCSCAVPADAHEMHHRPHNKAGDHLNPDCKHSELYNTLVRFPAMIAAKLEKSGRERKRNRKPIARFVG